MDGRPTEKRLVVALFQGRARDGDVAANMESMKHEIKKAASVGAKLILFPELFLSGYCLPAEQMRSVAEENDGPSFQELSEAAKQWSIAVLYGYPELDRSSGEDVLYNSAQLIDKDGSSLTNYRKTHMWISPELPRYEECFTAGSQLLEPVECCGIRISILICMDLSHPETSRCLALAGAQMIAVPTACTIKCDQRDLRMVVPTRALDNSLYVACVNHVGNGFEGCSICSDPDGTVLAFSGSDHDEALLLATVVVPLKSRYRTLNVRRPELYKRLTE